LGVAKTGMLEALVPMSSAVDQRKRPLVKTAYNTYYVKLRIGLHLSKSRPDPY